jgi:anti-sigma B factor antagonist
MQAGGAAVDVDVTTQADRAVISLRGELDLANVESVESAITQSNVRAARRIELDLAGLTFCDSSGLRMLLRVRSEAVGAGATFVVTHATGAVARTIDVTGLGSVLYGEG